MPFIASRAAELMPSNSEAKIELGRTAATALLGDPRRPKSLYQIVSNTSTALITADPNSAEGFRLKGYLAVVDAHSADAIDAFRKSLQSKPNQPDVLMTLAQTLLIDNQGPEAETLMRERLGQVPGTWPALRRALRLLHVLAECRRREKVLQQKISRNPDNSLYVRELAEFYWHENRPDDSARAERSDRGA